VEAEEELNRVLPADLPNREIVVSKAARHLALIEEANRYLNLTRIVSPHEAAIKHVLDSVMPWRLFADAEHVVDAGSGAGFPGVPLALALPATRFTLAESVQKKARFLETSVAALEMPNVTVAARRAEELTLAGGVDLITARALAPVSRVLDLFGPALRKGARVLLYKGPYADREIADAAREASRLRAQIRVAMRFDLPENMGSRTMIEIAAPQRPARDRC
jgi:16S rRNA (guanine527-N7)-methyltransferase